jgi:hypothetical protein
MSYVSCEEHQTRGIVPRKANNRTFGVHDYSAHAVGPLRPGPERDEHEQHGQQALQLWVLLPNLDDGLPDIRHDLAADPREQLPQDSDNQQQQLRRQRLRL